MRIAFYHGYELTGSGSNEYTRYLARYLTTAGHEVHIICREPQPQRIAHVSRVLSWTEEGIPTQRYLRPVSGAACVVHQLPHGDVRPVYLTDKQRNGNVKAFTALSPAELRKYHASNEQLLTNILSRFKMDLLHCNHLVYQPVAALNACQLTDTPMVIYPHGSAIEYTLKKDSRFSRLALDAISGTDGLIIGNREVTNRIINLYPHCSEMIRSKAQIVGVGVDTSLFRPVNRTKRNLAIDQLIRMGNGSGKSPEQSTELFARVASGDVKAVQAYWNEYDHSQPDTDLCDKLERISWNQNIILFVGALTSGKGLQSLIAAMPYILRNQPDTHLVIVGAGAYREVLEAAIFALASGNEQLFRTLCANGLSLDRNNQTGSWEDVEAYIEDAANFDQLFTTKDDFADHVHFLGRLDHSRLRYLFPCADLAVFPSIVPEAYPLVLMESLSNGVLPAVSYFSGFRDGVDELEESLGADLLDRMRLPVDPEIRVEAIAQNVSALLANPHVRSIGPLLRRLALNRYDWQIRSRQMVEAYESILAQRNVSRTLDTSEANNLLQE